MTVHNSSWQPTCIQYHLASLPSGAGTIHVRTDVGDGYLKAIGNPTGEHALACELIGTQLAAWLGLPVFDFAIIQITETDELPFAQGGYAKPGPAYITREEDGEPWGGNKRQLKQLENIQDISRLVVFDTWTLNCDRHAPNNARAPNRNNVFLSEEAPKGKFVLRAMDHTHCFTCGSALTKKLTHINKIKDPNLYGLFPEFREFLDREIVNECVEKLQHIDHQTLTQIIQTIPPEWDVNETTQDALKSLLLGRAHYVADCIIDKLWSQQEFRFMHESEEI